MEISTLPRVFLDGGYSHALVLRRWIPPSPGRVCFCFSKLFLRAGAGSSKGPDSCMLWRGFEEEDFPRVRLSDTEEPKAGLNYGRIGQMRGEFGYDSLVLTRRLEERIR